MIEVDVKLKVGAFSLEVGIRERRRHNGAVWPIGFRKIRDPQSHRGIDAA